MHRRTPLRMGPLRFRDPVLLCGVLYGLLLFDASGFLRTGLLAAFLHEAGRRRARMPFTPSTALASLVQPLPRYSCLNLPL